MTRTKDLVIQMGLILCSALQKRREEFVLHLKASELISMVELILAEAETRYQNTEEASCTLIQSRLPLLLSCSHGDLESMKKVTEYLTSCIQQWGSRWGLQMETLSTLIVVIWAQAVR